MDGFDFIKGFDLSTLPEVEHCGGRFFQGGVQKDPVEILKGSGMNLVRLRLWNDPYSPEGKPYGAGTNDLACTLALAARMKQAGLGWLLDFHYSDFWADPGKQTVPKAWAGLDADGLEHAVYRYTKTVLARCKAEGIPPAMVAVGNELSNGLLWPLGKRPHWDEIARFVRSGVRAVREELPGVPVMLHLDNGGNHALYREWFDAFTVRGGDFDIIGLSYYPFWHGTLQMLADNMNDLAVRYGKDVIVAETSMGFTVENYARREQLPEGKRKGMATKPELCAGLAWPMTPQGQSDFMRDLISVIRAVPQGHGKGFFYWEPAWIPVPGSGWAEQPGWEYVHEKGPGGNEWANQALFDYDGNALPALEAIRTC
jgi:arabinogalactan endo-1,4-beta-galactosidase